MYVDTSMLGERVFFAVLDDNDENWEVVAGDIYGVIVDVELKRTWIQYRIDTADGPHVISEDYVFPIEAGAAQRCSILNGVKVKMS